MKTHFFNYLRFTRAERNGTLALFLLAATLFALPEITRHRHNTLSTNFSPFRNETQAFREALGQTADQPRNVLFEFNPNTASVEEFVRLGLSEKLANIICNYRNKGGNFREAADLQKIWSLSKEDYERLLPYIRIQSAEQAPLEKSAEKPPPQVFAFDPNTATESELFRLGLPSRTVKSILNYRIKGGQFRKKEDLEKIYTLSDEDYARIATYATFSAPMATAAPRPVMYAASGWTDASKPPAKGPVDINDATLEDWMSLPGIGEKRAQQLLSFREKLGGFVSVEQLREMYGLPDSVYQSIKPSLVMYANNIRKINLNTVSVADLDAHPYISKRQAEVIVAYREQHGAFASPDDLDNMRALSDKVWVAKVKPYLGVN